MTTTNITPRVNDNSSAAKVILITVTLLLVLLSSVIFYGVKKYNALRAQYKTVYIALDSIKMGTNINKNQFKAETIIPKEEPFAFESSSCKKPYLKVFMTTGAQLTKSSVGCAEEAPFTEERFKQGVRLYVLRVNTYDENIDIGSADSQAPAKADIHISGVNGKSHVIRNVFLSKVSPAPHGGGDLDFYLLLNDAQDVQRLFFAQSEGMRIALKTKQP
ncbi:hypothetical protein Dip510_000469 [Elusimicrobium posterum]|uniref:hypothetical protein n=1 Tax=Elusimicrobium posterum TaxID=3116653 RepID=UPI003C725943